MNTNVVMGIPILHSRWGWDKKFIPVEYENENEEEILLCDEDGDSQTRIRLVCCHPWLGLPTS